MEVFTWWNLLFLLPLAFAALFLLMNTIGITGDTDVDAEAHVDTEHDINHDINHDTDHDTDDDAGDGARSSRTFLEFLGGGRIPVTLIFQIFFFAWGITGWILNLLLKPILREPLIFVWVSIAGAFAVSAFSTRLIGKLIWKYAPLSETYAKEREDLIGCEGEALYSITSESGMAQIYDDRGSLHRIYCRIDTEGESIASGDRILIVGYDRQEDLYFVKRSPLAGMKQQGEIIRHS
ncbi:YqiJ family protein [bacterium]|nr:YqiJ family protein [bacterium]MCI0607119.1 YqiJ family protein [bacterium]